MYKNNSWGTLDFWLHGVIGVWMIIWLKRAKRTWRNSSQVHLSAHITRIWSVMRGLLVAVTCDRLIRLQITGLIERSHSRIGRRTVAVWGYSGTEMGCIMVDLFIVLMYLGRYSVSMYTWIEREWRLAVESMWPFSIHYFAECLCLFFSGGPGELTFRKVLGGTDEKECFFIHHQNTFGCFPNLIIRT